MALAKTLAMTSGEVDFGATVQPFDYLHEVDVQSDFLSIVFYPISTNIVMAVFIIIMPILINNLLVSGDPTSGQGPLLLSYLVN